MSLAAACGGDDGMAADASSRDGGASDGGRLDAGEMDSGAADAAVADAGRDRAIADAAAVDGANLDGAADVDAGRCVDDRREEDDDHGTAMAQMALMGPRPVAVDGQVACPADDDVLHAYADCCTPAGAEVRWDPAQGALEVELLDGTGAVMALGAADVIMRGAGRIELRKADYGGDFYVRVQNASGRPIDYAVTVYAMVYVR